MWERVVKALGVVTIVLCVLAIPALVGLVGTARGYLDTTADIAALRIEIVELRPSTDTTRAYPGPDITLRVYGVAQAALTFEEVNFDLLLDGQRVATVAAFPRLAIPRNGSLAVNVTSNLDAAYAEATRARIAAGERRFFVAGNARVGLPNSSTSVWLALNGQVRAAGSVAPSAVGSGPRSLAGQFVDRRSSIVNRHSPLVPDA